MERDIHLDPYHVRFVHVSLTRNLGVRIPDMQDEIATAFADLIPAKDGMGLRVHFHILLYTEGMH